MFSFPTKLCTKTHSFVSRDARILYSEELELLHAKQHQVWNTCEAQNKEMIDCLLITNCHFLSHTSILVLRLLWKIVRNKNRNKMGEYKRLITTNTRAEGEMSYKNNQWLRRQDRRSYEMAALEIMTGHSFMKVLYAFNPNHFHLIWSDGLQGYLSMRSKMLKIQWRRNDRSTFQLLMF